MAVDTSSPIAAAASRMPRPRRTAAILAWCLLAAWLSLSGVRAVFVMLDAAADIEHPVAADVPALEPQGIAGGLVFLVLGALTVALAVAVHTSEGARPRSALGALIGGVTAGVALVITGITARASFSWMSANLAEVTADRDAQAAALWVLSTSGGELFLALIGTAAWIVLTLIAGGTIGRGWGWAAGVVAIAGAVVGWGFALPAAQTLYVPFYLLIAVGLTRAARRAGEAAVHES